MIACLNHPKDLCEINQINSCVSKEVARYSGLRVCIRCYNHIFLLIFFFTTSRFPNKIAPDRISLWVVSTKWRWRHTLLHGLAFWVEGTLFEIWSTLTFSLLWNLISFSSLEFNFFLCSSSSVNHSYLSLHDIPMWTIC